MKISVNYINRGSDLLFNDDVNIYESFCDKYIDEVDKAMVEYKIACSDDGIFDTLTFMEADETNSSDKKEKAKKSVIEKIGAALIAMGKKFSELVQKAIQKVKDLFFKFKSNEKKMNELVKSHPELTKEKIQLLCSEGELDFDMIKSMSQLQKEFDAIMKMSEEADYKPGSMRAKWEKAKRKWFDTQDGKLIKAGKIAVAGAAVIGLAVAIKEIKPKFSKANTNFVQSEKENSEAIAKAYDNLKKNGYLKNVGFHQEKLMIRKEMQGLHAKAIGMTTSLLSKLEMSIAKALDKIDTNADKKKLAAHIDIRNTKNRIRADKKEALRDETIKAFKTGEAQQSGRYASDINHQSQLKQMSADKIKSDTKAKAEAELEILKSKQGEELSQLKRDEAFKTSKEQQRGRHEADFELQDRLNKMSADKIASDTEAEIKAELKGLKSPEGQELSQLKMNEIKNKAYNEAIERFKAQADAYEIPKVKKYFYKKLRDEILDSQIFEKDKKTKRR